MKSEFQERSGRLYLIGRQKPVLFSWIGGNGGRLFFVEPGTLLVVSIPEAFVAAIVFDAAIAA